MNLCIMYVCGFFADTFGLILQHEAPCTVDTAVTVLWLQSGTADWHSSSVRFTYIMCSICMYIYMYTCCSTCPACIPYVHTHTHSHALFAPQSYHIAVTETFTLTSYTRTPIDVTASVLYDDCTCTNGRRRCRNRFNNVYSQTMREARFGEWLDGQFD